ncbi:retrovirus-related pol polyprotein from transposon TNT 1-94 [Tanacetum coccineum]|uniref:Retrovirus-related pol polyprotein from transposon TNT 1-94 n=1 Tax=Tanacetum coccineum TaxID=301880 RepID=A0ABQ5CR32_9ASTR
MYDAKFNSLDEKAHSTILLSLSDEVLYEVADEETAAGFEECDARLMMKMLLYSVLVSLPPSACHQASGNFGYSTVGLSIRSQDEAGIEHKEAKEKEDIKIDRSRDLEDLKKNLISLGVFDSKGFKYMSENGVLRVSKEFGGYEALKVSGGLLDNHKVAILCFVGALGMGKQKRMTWVFMMKHKSEAFEKFKHWKILIENQTGRKIKRLRTDNVKESLPPLLIARIQLKFGTGKPAEIKTLRVFGCPRVLSVGDGMLNREHKGIFYGDTVDGLKLAECGHHREKKSFLAEMWTFDEDHSMGEEIEFLSRTFNGALVKLPEGRKVVGCTFGAKNLAKGGIDYNEIFSQCKSFIYSCVTYLSSTMIGNSKQLDVKTAFLHGDLEEEIYMSQPEGFIVQSKEDYVWHRRDHLSTYSCTLRICLAKELEEIKKLRIILNHGSIGNAVKRIFRYLKGTSDVGLIYGGEREYLVAGYSDSDYAADLDARRSLTGYVFTIGSSVILGFPQDQAIVSLSIDECLSVFLAKNMLP